MELLEEQAARRARTNLFELAKYLAPAEYVFNWHHALIYRKLYDFATGKIKRMIVEAPPGHGKSEAVSRVLPAGIFGWNQDARIIACSYTQDLASEMNRDVQRLMDKPEYRRTFPGVRWGTSKEKGDRQNSSIFDIPGRRGFYKCAGVGGGISGRRFDRGIIDDPVKDREEANSPTHRERIWRWFTSVFCKRQAKGAGILITTTRWHEDDLAGRIKAKMKAGDIEPYEVITLPALATDNLHADDPRKPGEALWPWLRSVEELEQARRTEPRDFYALEQQDPRQEGATEWPASYFPDSIWFDDWPNDMRLVVMSLDPSKGKDAKTGDYSAIITLGMDTRGCYWCEADMSNTRPVTKIISDCYGCYEEARRQMDGRPVEGFGVEANAFQELLADLIDKEFVGKGFAGTVYKINNTINKHVRIRRLTGDLMKGNIRFRNTAGTRLLVRQLQQFPVDDHDDGPDALEMARRLAIQIWNGRQQRGRRR